ncbi:6327_t:CDS:2, partial [Acaulospora morrowiae]
DISTRRSRDPEFSLKSDANRISAYLAMFVSLTYEVFGKVQGVFFRKFTREKAIELKLVGW